MTYIYKQKNKNTKKPKKQTNTKKKCPNLEMD